jgi:hypothetical protein
LIFSHFTTTFANVLGYNKIKRVKKRIDILLLKNLEFRTNVGQKVKILDIPVLEEDNPLFFKVNARLQLFLSQIHHQSSPKKVYSFREYLKKVLKWTEYEQIYQVNVLKNNA